MTFKEELQKLNACEEAIEWVGDRTLEQAWNECERGDWMLWFAQMKRVDIRKITLAKARFVRLVMHLMKDERNRNAVEVAERFGLGEATREELEEARATADDAANDAVADAAEDASSVYASFATTYATIAACAVYAVSVSTKETLKKCADICRKILTDEVLIKEES